MEASPAIESLYPVDLSRCTDTELCEAGSRGSQLAFDELHNRHHRALSAFVFHTLGDGHRRDDTEDVVQDSFARAFSKIADGGFDGAFRAWLFTIARNRSIDLIRSERVRLVPIDGDETERGAAPTTSSRPTDPELRDEFSWLVGAIADLPERQRAALLLSELGGFSHEAIADQLGASTGSVRQLVGRARESLRENAVRDGHASGSGRDFRRGLMETTPLLPAAGLGAAAMVGAGAGAGAGAMAGAAKVAATLIAAIVVAGAAVGVDQGVLPGGKAHSANGSEQTAPVVASASAERQGDVAGREIARRAGAAKTGGRIERLASRGAPGQRPAGGTAETPQGRSDETQQQPERPSTTETAAPTPKQPPLDPVVELPGRLVDDLNGALTGQQDLGQTVGNLTGTLGETTSGLLGGR
ncbi:MAG: sigma-70 family RNA polymerase sigma factor [Solirubrobacterales bacterium]